MNPVRPANHHRHLVFIRALLQCGQQAVQSFDQKAGSGLELKRKSGVHNIRRSEPVVNIAGLGPDELRHGCCKSNDVVFDLFLNFLNAGDVEVRFGLDGRYRIARDDAGLGQNFTGCDLHRQPLAISVFFGPNGAHLRTRVTGDQAVTLSKLRR